MPKALDTGLYLGAERPRCCVGELSEHGDAAEEVSARWETQYAARVRSGEAAPVEQMRRRVVRPSDADDVVAGFRDVANGRSPVTAAAPRRLLTLRQCWALLAAWSVKVPATSGSPGPGSTIPANRSAFVLPLSPGERVLSSDRYAERRRMF